MNTLPSKGLVLAGIFAVCSVFAHAQVVRLQATITAAQETPATSSPATGSAIMLYDVAANTFDLIVSISNFANPISGSHLHEAPPGTAGSVATSLGAESAYVRNGTSVTAVFRGIAYGGDKLKLLQGGTYYNVHSAQFPGGEIRGQLIPQPKRLVAILTPGQAGASVDSRASGAAVMWYDPAANRLSLRVSVFNFANTLTNSHIHEAPQGASGGVVLPLGGASVYANAGGFYSGSFDVPYTGDPVKLLTRGAYLNVHSNVYPAGEIRGQVLPDDEAVESRFINLSSRGQVGAGNQVLIQGFSVLGPEPLRVLITAKGPSLSAFGVSGALSDPMVALYDSAGRQIAANNDVGTVAAGSELAAIPGVPTNGLESALVVVLPPGNYSAVASGNNGTSGIALLEVTDLRVVGAGVTTAR